MRRRVWNFIYQTDLLFSFQLGLPPAVRAREYDTLQTRNICEEQLYPQMSTAASPMSGDEPTYISYMFAQNAVFRVFGDIVEAVNTLQPQPYSSILQLDMRLSAAFATTPPHLRREVPDSWTDPPQLVLQRIESELFYHKVNCILHRRYLTAQFRDQRYEPSRQACITSALRLLSCQTALHDSRRWPLRKWWTSSLNSHDFILAATILCLYLSTDGPNSSTVQKPEIANLREALRQSFAIWSEVQNACVDAGKAFIIFDSLKRQHPDLLLPQNQEAVPMIDSRLTSGTITDTLSTSPSLFPSHASTDFSKSIDWNLWDSYLRDMEPLPGWPFPEVNASEDL